MSTAGIAYRQSWAAVPVGSLLESGLEACATIALVRIQSVRRTRGCGCWLFVDSEGRVYVLSDEASALSGMQRDHPDWLVGYFCDADSGKSLRPAITLTDLQEAIVDHMAGPAPLMAGAAHAA